MPTETLRRLLELPRAERIDLALSLWDSLDDAERDAACPPTDADLAEFERRFADHVADSSSSVDWEDVRRRLRGRR